jgi:hypothetical protein
LSEGVRKAFFDSSSSSFSTIRAGFEDEDEDEINREVYFHTQEITRGTSHLREWMEQCWGAAKS